ncbi:MAG: thioredoxin family protein [Bacteroidales bacterium]|nr:thioredoxin family protein [Bacteroidales bacterium]
MALIEIKSHNDLLSNINDKERAYVLLYKAGSETSECALRNLKAASEEKSDVDLYYADVSSVRDIHFRYSITSAPTLLVFENGEFKNVVKGCNDPKYYINLFENALFSAAADEDGKPQKSVTVYSTPTCPHCNTLKTHLRKHGIRFTDIDVSTDQSKAEELVRKSGQQGVPQTEVNGEIIVGFDKTRINKLLEIQG